MDVDDDRSGDASTRGSAGASSSAVGPEDGSDASARESTRRRYHAHAQTDHASADVRTAFQLEVREAFHALTTTYGFDPNDAAALALKLAAKMAEWPLDLRGLLDACARASAVPSRSVNPRAVADAREEVRAVVDRVFSSPDALNSSFVPPRRRRARLDPNRDPPDLDLDVDALSRCYEALERAGEDAADAAAAALTVALESIDETRDWRAAGPALARLLIVALSCPALAEPEHARGFERLVVVAAAAPHRDADVLVAAARSLGVRRFARAVAAARQFVTVRLCESGGAVDRGVACGMVFLGMLDEANEPPANGALGEGVDAGREGDADLSDADEERLEDEERLASSSSREKETLVPYSAFYVDVVNDDDFDAAEDYRRWRRGDAASASFSFCEYPFALDPAAKARVLRLESNERMSDEFEDAVLRSIFVGATSPYLVLRVRREHLVEDTLREAQRRRADLRKPLKVEFVGEQGVDEGGVAKEFFQVLCRRLFDPDFGMFSCDEDTRAVWFSPNAVAVGGMRVEYELIGILVGLAVYNGHILEFRFPTVIYRMLLGGEAFRPRLRDLREVNPWAHDGLRALLRAETAEEVAAFGLSFRATTEVLGDAVETDLAPGGGDVAVTLENRREYVRAYLRWALVDSIAAQFGAFRSGFELMCAGPAMALFRPEELELLVCGSAELDFDALERGTVYQDGYVAESPTMRYFWKVVHGMTETQKKRLLFFTTGSDRVPIKGLGNLPFVVSKNGTEPRRLPTAHTCFNHLLLPQYEDEETLRERLTTAIENAEGFGLQ